MTNPTVVRKTAFDGLGDDASAPPSLAYTSLAEAFPEVDSGMKRPFGSRVLVQIRTPMTRSRGGIVLSEQSRETEKWNTQVAKVIALGPVAFCNRDTLEPWKEGAWATPGTYARVPMYGGDRWDVPVPGSADKAWFVVFNDADLVGEIDPSKVLDIIAYI